jgi:hypothetical protein
MREGVDVRERLKKTASGPPAQARKARVRADEVGRSESGLADSERESARLARAAQRVCVR